MTKPKKDIIIQEWKNNWGDGEYQHFLNDKYGTYVFGINKKLVGQKVYKQILKLIKKNI